MKTEIRKWSCAEASTGSEENLESRNGTKCGIVLKLSFSQMHHVK